MPGGLLGTGTMRAAMVAEGAGPEWGARAGVVGLLRKQCGL
jgi:hypothetical protein